MRIKYLKPALKNLQIKARAKVRSSWNQDCGAETKISVSCSRHPKFVTPDPERFGPLKNKKNTALFVLASCYTKYVCWMGTQISGSGSIIQKFLDPFPGFCSTALVGTNCFWKWISVLIVCFHKCNYIRFVVRFLCKLNCPFISLAWKFSN